jgi:enoyl-CoA hydratase
VTVRVEVPVGQARVEAEALARSLADLPQECLRHDRLSVLEQEGLTEVESMAGELRHGLVSLAGDGIEGAARFVAGEGRHGR